jgi:hypothetical protein
VRKSIVPAAMAAAAVAASAATAPSADAASATAPSAAAPSAGAAALRSFEGKVLSVDPSPRSFRLRDRERGTHRFRVKSSTRFHRIAGFGALHAGMRRVEVTARRSGGRWIATLVERSGGGGSHGGDD